MQHPVRCLVLTPAFFLKEDAKRKCTYRMVKCDVLCDIRVWHFVKQKVKGFCVYI